MTDRKKAPEYYFVAKEYMPGVWSLGGTSYAVLTAARRCDLQSKLAPLDMDDVVLELDEFGSADSRLITGDELATWIGEKP